MLAIYHVATFLEPNDTAVHRRLHRPHRGTTQARTMSKAAAHRGTIISLAARNNVPAIYPWRSVVANDGALLSYGPDRRDIVRRGAPYVDRILRGEKPADLPVQIPTKFEMAVNINTAKTLGLTVPPTLLARADEVIE